MCCHATHAREGFYRYLGDFELDIRRHAGEISGVRESVGDTHLPQDLAQGRLGRDGELGQEQFHGAARETTATINQIPLESQSENQLPTLPLQYMDKYRVCLSHFIANSNQNHEL